MQAYINGTGIVSPQKTFERGGFLDDIVISTTNSFRSIEPSYKEFLNPALARRMGRIIKMSIAASTACLRDSNIEMPDAIMTGTALGCHEDTEKFLLSIIDNDEQFLTPTSFMQSTHNTVSAQIALQLKCMNYNFTYVHKGFSFESALLDALMTLKEGTGHNILVGAHDEMTDRHFSITGRVGYWKKELISSKDLYSIKSEGSISGEGASFFMLGDKPGKNCYARLLGMKMIYRPESNTVQEKAAKLLEENNISAKDIDLVIYGFGGDTRFDASYSSLQQKMFPATAAAGFKHLCGEYQTSSGFAMWMAAMILREQKIPANTVLNGVPPKEVRNILIYNSFMGANHSLFLLSRC